MANLGERYEYVDDAKFEEDSRHTICPPLLKVFDKHKEDHPPYGINTDAKVCLANQYNSRWKVDSGEES